ncbi:GntR family transcriptional regulator [Desulfospira joergensenii]|uniref:GntR family transcriptional regulator n=1 Tax=Desulfospira joergensenii TaxID=53329 RepID=UPI000480BEFF|nr:GntR family transcriptional regulator [Desulfospira joergensenii]
MPQKTKDAAKDIIYRKIRTEIITGRKKPGERLSIDLLKKEFGTSVTPVRDALQMLGQEELVTIKPRSGYYVTLITLKELNDMLDLRCILELASAALAAERVTEEQISRLETVHAGYTDDGDESNARYTEENKKFHYLVAQASGNHELALQIAHIHDRLARFVVMSTTGKKIAQTHSILIGRLKAHDAAGAQKAMKKEIDDGRKLIMDRIMQEEANYWHLGATGSSDH